VRHLGLNNCQNDWAVRPTDKGFGLRKVRVIETITCLRYVD